MRWCCGSGGGNNHDSSSTPSTVNNKTTTRTSTMMTELSLKSGKNSSKLSKKDEKRGKKNGEEYIGERHCVFQQKDDEHQVIQMDVPNAGMNEVSRQRRGVLKSSLKILQSRNSASKPVKGVQYADEIRIAEPKNVLEMEEESGAAEADERARLLKQPMDAEEEDEKMDVCGTRSLGSEKIENFSQQQQQQKPQRQRNTSFENDTKKKVSVESDNGKAEGEDSFSELHSYSMQSPINRQSPAIANSRILKSQHSSSPLYDKYGPMLVRTCKTIVYISALPSFSNTIILPSASNVNSNISLPHVFECLQRAGWTIFITNRTNFVLEIQARRPVVILVDDRVDDFENFLISLRSLTECEDTLISALFESEEKAAKFQVPHFLLYTSGDISLCELFARLASRLRAIPALFAVIEEAEQPIKICDENNIAQYVNRAYEFATGRLRNDVLGSDASEMREKTINNFGTLGSWNSSSALLPPTGSFSTSNRQPVQCIEISPTSPSTNTSSALSAQRHSLPTSSAPGTSVSSGMDSATSTTTVGGNNSTFVNAVNRRRSSEWHCITVPSCSTMSPQFVYVKRGSADAIGRDLSLKNLRSHSALVEAPITEALNVLDSVLHRCAEDEAIQMQVRDAIKILSTAELYAPTITRFRDNDRIASGYYDGLIRLHHPSRQRKRSVVDAFRENQQRRISAGSGLSASGIVSSSTNADATDGNSFASRRRISADVINALENENTWNFDVIELERVTEHRPLSQLGIKVFERWDAPNSLRCSPDILARWLQVIEANYQAGNAYHNATHAADVLQATSFFLNSDAVGQYVQSQHALSALIAATVHDLDHPGRGNAFLMNTRSQLAVLYNDHSVLENHHVALAFKLTLTQPGVNIFARLPADEFSQIRQAIIDMVLATDMSRHFEYLTKFQQLLGVLPSDVEENRDANSLTICRMMIKCADIANPTREWKLCYQWAIRIVVEYFEQTAEEAEKNLPLTMKGFDCSTCNIPLTQCTFMDMFAREAFTSWCEFAELPHLLTQLESNYECWKAQSTDWDPRQNSNILQRRQGVLGN